MLCVGVVDFTVFEFLKSGIAIGKRKPHSVKPYLEKLQWFAENDVHPVVRIHSAGAVRITKKALEKMKNAANE